METETKRNFKFYPQWIGFVSTLKTSTERLQMYEAIVDYGTTGDYPTHLQGRQREYFDTKVKPLIDK